MLSQKTKLRKAAFNAQILCTFGKLSEQDIEKIDGQSPLLVSELVERYDWSEAFARTKVLALDASLAKDELEKS